MGFEIHEGDALERLAAMPEASLDSCVCDPPYGLEFMGKDWDRLGRQHALRGKTSGLPVGPGSGRGTNPVAGKPGFDLSLSAQRAMQAWHEVWAREVFRVLKPGAYLLSFGGSRTSHRMVCAIEDAGFEIRDTIMWLYGSGFPKSLDVSKAIDRAAGADREVVGFSNPSDPRSGGRRGKVGSTLCGSADGSLNRGEPYPLTAPATDLARQWQGWGTALKPAHEPIVVARKPLVGTIAANVERYGTGAIHIDACRIGFASDEDERESKTKNQHADFGSKPPERVAFGRDDRPAQNYNPPGRWPANVILDEEAGRMLDEQSGKVGSHGGGKSEYPDNARIYGRFKTSTRHDFGDKGHASRFFYCPKASRAERGAGNNHPTVKPLALMRYLCRLVTPPNGTVLDPFCGSGSTGIAALAEGFNFVGIEQSAEYVEIARRRIAEVESRHPLLAGGVSQKVTGQPLSTIALRFNQPGNTDSEVPPTVTIRNNGSVAQSAEVVQA